MPDNRIARQDMSGFYHIPPSLATSPLLICFHSFLSCPLNTYSALAGRARRMERNKQVTVFGIVVIALMWLGAVLGAVAISQEHPVRVALITLVAFPALLVVVLAAIAGLNVLIFAPFLKLLGRLGKSKEKGDGIPVGE